MQTSSVPSGIAPVDQLVATLQAPLVAVEELPLGPYHVSHPAACALATETAKAPKVKMQMRSERIRVTMNPFVVIGNPTGPKHPRTRHVVARGDARPSRRWSGSTQRRSLQAVLVAASELRRSPRSAASTAVF